MSIVNCEMEPVAHIHIEDREFNVYMCICYSTMTLHAYKYDEESINYEWFNDLSEFESWVQSPIRRVLQYSILDSECQVQNPISKIVLRCEQFLFADKIDSYLETNRLKGQLGQLNRGTSFVSLRVVLPCSCCFIPLVCIYYTLTRSNCQPIFLLDF